MLLSRVIICGSDQTSQYKLIPIWNLELQHWCCALDSDLLLSIAKIFLIRFERRKVCWRNVKAKEASDGALHGKAIWSHAWT